MSIQTNSMGNDGFYFFFGVVECTSDPEKLGRVQVRVLGDHTQNKSDIPSADLPWAMPLMPVTTASMNGIGHAPIGLVQGSWVMGFYRDGIDKQQPIVMGSIGGIPLDPSSASAGFNDPIECFPQTSKLSEPDTNRHARGTVGKHVKEPVPVTLRKENIIKNVATATMQWTEPESPYAPIYPYNYVWEGFYNPTCDECEWGHLEEWDSTPGSERYFRQHKTSQNFLEIHPDGKEVRKIYGDGFEIDLANKHLYVEGDYRVTISGNKDEHIKGDYWQHIEGDMIRVVDGSKSVITKGNDSTTVYSDIVRRSSGSTTDSTLNNHVRIANSNIYDSAGSKYVAVATSEATIGVGSFSPVSITEISPVSVMSDGYKSVILSCKEENKTKAEFGTSIIPTMPGHGTTASGVEVTQVKVIPGVIFHDAPITNNLGDLRVATRVTTPLLHAPAPYGYDPEVGHGYIIPTANTPPSTPAKGVVNNTATIDTEVYVATIKNPVPVVPGEIHKCS